MVTGYYYYPELALVIDPKNLLSLKIIRRLKTNKQYIVRSKKVHDAWVSSVPSEFSKLVTKVYKKEPLIKKEVPIGPPKIPLYLLHKKLLPTLTPKILLQNNLLTLSSDGHFINTSKLEQFIQLIKEYWKGAPKKIDSIILPPSLLTETIQLLLAPFKDNLKPNLSYNLSTTQYNDIDKTYNIRPWLKTEEKYDKLKDLLFSLKNVFTANPSEAVNLTLFFTDGSASEPIYIDSNNYAEYQNTLGRTFNKGFNPETSSGDAEFIMDANNQYFVNFMLQYVKRKKEKRGICRRKGGWINLVMREKFTKSQPKERVDFFQNILGIPHYKNLNTAVHYSCIVFAIFNSNIRHLLSERTKLSLAKGANTLFYNLETIEINKNLLPILKNNHPSSILGIKLKYKKNATDKKFEVLTYGDVTTKSNFVLKLGCIENHYIPDTYENNNTSSSIITSSFQGQRNDLDFSSFRLFEGLLKNPGRCDELGLTPFTDKELINVDIEGANKQVKEILKKQYKVDIHSGLPIMGMEKEYVKTKPYKFNHHSSSPFDGIIGFDTETAPNPDNQFKSELYLGVAIGFKGKPFRIENDMTGLLVRETTAKSFSESIIKEIKKRSLKKIVAIAYNASFDVNALVATALYNTQNIVRNGKIISTTYHFKDSIEITVIDLWRMISTSLKVAAESFNVEFRKQDFPHHILSYTEEWRRILAPGFYTNVSKIRREDDDYFNWDVFLSFGKEVGAVVTILSINNNYDVMVSLGDIAYHYCLLDCKVMEQVLYKYQESLNKMCIELGIPEEDKQYLTESYSLPSIGFNIVKKMGGLDGCFAEPSLIYETIGKDYMTAGRTIAGAVEDPIIRDGKRIPDLILFDLEHTVIADVVSLYPSAIVSSVGGFPATGSSPVILRKGITFSDFFRLHRNYPNFQCGVRPKTKTLRFCGKPLGLPVLSSNKLTKKNGTRAWVNELYRDEIYYPTNFCLTTLISLHQESSLFTKLDTINLVFNHWGKGKINAELEVNLGLELDKIFDIEFIIYFPDCKSNTKIQDYVKYMFKHKSNKKSEMHFMAKLYLNAPIGKFAVKHTPIEEKIIKAADMNETLQSRNNYISHSKINYSVNGLNIVKFKNYAANNKNLNYSHIANFIWAASRWLMNMYESCLPEGVVIKNSDTDSLAIPLRVLRVFEQNAIKLTLIPAGGFNSTFIGNISNDLAKNGETFEELFIVKFCPFIRKVYRITTNTGVDVFKAKSVSKISMKNMIEVVYEGNCDQLCRDIVFGGGVEFNNVVGTNCRMKRASDNSYIVLENQKKTIKC